MKLQDMITAYEDKTGETVSLDGFFFDADFRSADNVHFKYFPDVGFLFWGIMERDGVRFFTMLQTFGRMAGMVTYIKDVMRLNGLTDILTFTTRNPKAHIRKWKMERLPAYDYEYEGRHYYVLKGTADNLRLKE